MSEPQQARAIETRERVLLGAAETFAAKGYEGASIADILNASGVTRGAMYFHFASKEALGRAIVVLQTRLVDGFTVGEGTPAAQQMIDLSLDFGRALQTDPLIRASVRMTTEGHGFDAEQRLTFDRWLDLARQLAEQAMAQGSIRDGWNAPQVAETLTAGVNGIQSSSLIYANYADMLDRLHTFWSMLAPGLFTDEARAQLVY